MVANWRPERQRERHAVARAVGPQAVRRAAPGLSRLRLARQIVAAVLTVSREWTGLAQADAGLAKLLATLEQDFDLKPYASRRDRIMIVLRKFNEMNKDKYLADAAALDSLERMASTGSEAAKEQDPDVQRDLTRFLDALRRQSPREFSEALLADSSVAKAWTTSTIRSCNARWRKSASTTRCGSNSSCRRWRTPCPRRTEIRGPAGIVVTYRRNLAGQLTL